MKFFRALKKAALFILKSTAILIVGLTTTTVILLLVLAVSAEVVNYKKYDKALDIDIPSRKADYFEDTHGGFHGDGDMTEIFYLTDKENKKIAADIEKSGVWKEIDDEAHGRLYGTDGYGGYFSDNVPEAENGLYCFYNKQNDTYAFPEGVPYSYNYITGLYSESEKTLWIYEMDT